eukprot:TRINITY_DN7420_c0_g1_i7.p3 TRINITY_DN7420_c0_g1~~TRINITY_DN7420_c0_g1_i7.p3  ORF type:complete len:180 (+),score=35.99 TRINITY_DN7420_c0_g1_i7:959-1498(+)
MPSKKKRRVKRVNKKDVVKKIDKKIAIIDKKINSVLSEIEVVEKMIKEVNERAKHTPEMNHTNPAMSRNKPSVSTKPKKIAAGAKRIIQNILRSNARANEQESNKLHNNLLTDFSIIKTKNNHPVEERKWTEVQTSTEIANRSIGESILDANKQEKPKIVINFERMIDVDRKAEDMELS